MEEQIKQLEQENAQLAEQLSQKDTLIRALENELVNMTPYLRKLADYQAAHIDQIHTH